MPSEFEKLDGWVLETIELLAKKQLTEASAKRIIYDEAAYLGKTIAKLQQRARTDPQFRQQITNEAQRRNVGGARPITNPTHQVNLADPGIAARWGRVGIWTCKLEPDHPWRQLHRELTWNLLDSHDVPDQGLGILELLEQALELHGLVTPDLATITQIGAAA